MSSAASRTRTPARSIRSREFRVSPLLGGIELLRAVYQGHRFSPHTQNTAVIGFAERGTAVVYGANDELLLTPGSVLVIPPGVLHAAQSLGAEHWYYRAFYLTVPQLHALGCGPIGEATVLGTRPYVLSRRSTARQVIAVHDALTNEDSRESDLVPMLAQLLSAITPRVAANPLPECDEGMVAGGIALARRLIDDDPLTRRTIGEMARAARLGRFTFAHAFSRAYGIAPHAYALQRRVAVVRDFLASGEEVSRVAHRVGFADQSHLTRRFLSVVGVTPGEFRRAWRGRRNPGPRLLVRAPAMAHH